MSHARRTKLPRPESLETILGRSGENRFAPIRPAVAPSVWRDAVGPRIAERARPISLCGGVLVLRVATNVWAHELSMLTAEVCSRLRARGVLAHELRFHVGSLGALDRPPERRTARSVPRSLELPRELAAAIARLDDPGLREAIAHAATANLAWQSVARVAPPQTGPSVSSVRLDGSGAPRPPGDC
ncbi:MAG: DUF721 domain-containing protein [Polyangiaceae bacterium]|jgi:hypothetical protein